ncbi:MAG: two-component sensor histidine kinase [Polyangiaceae bacterium]|nr:two-component sensor histidine kinase [Polyangiaceae bacterium]
MKKRRDRKLTPPPVQSDLRGLRPASSERRARTAPSSDRLESLLALANALDPRLPPRALVRELVRAVAPLLPAALLGVRLVDDDAQVSWLRSPHAVPEMAAPSTLRLFPDLAEEHHVIVDLATGSTLHLAASNLPAPSSEDWAVFEHVRALLESRLAHSRAFALAERDARDLRRLQAQMVQAEKLASLGQIAAGVMHELNNPLTSIVTYTEYLSLMAQKRQANEDELERLARIGEAADRILKFSRDLMAYARPAANVPGPVALADVIDKALVFCEHELSESRVTVERGSAAPLMVRGVAGQLTQVFVNLFTNAAHALGPTGGALRIGWSQATDRVMVRVSDDGPGIAGSDLERIFEPFFTTKEPGRGTGLGLSIVRRIVEGHGGTLIAESEPGLGATFVVELPLAVLPTDRPPA